MALTVELSNLLEYLQGSATRSAVLWPALLSCLLWLIARNQPLPRSHLIVWLMGIALSIVCSVWRHEGDSLSLHMLAGYPLLLVLLARHERPSPLQAYSLTFLSLLIADVFVRLAISSRTRTWPRVTSTKALAVRDCATASSSCRSQCCS